MAQETLANGATVLLRNYDVVLCKWRGEFVPWKTDSNGNAYWGHYFKWMPDALVDFMDRIGA